MSDAIQRHETRNGIMSCAVEAAGLVVTRGVLAPDLGQDIKGQTRQILAEIDRLLALAGSDRSKAVWTSFWLSDIRDIQGLNEVWLEWTGGANLPARATVECKLAQPKALVEIAIIAGK